MKQALKIFFLTLILSLFSHAYAQTVNDSIPAQIPELQEQISVNVTPQFPKPLDQVTISLEAYGTNLDQAPITWKVDGVVAKTGVGLKTFTIQAGKIGVTRQITITVSPKNAPQIIRTVTISPQELDLLWEARTYTPPFYRGKALYTPQENVVVVAMPNFVTAAGAKVDPDTLVYTWRKDDEVDGDASGHGKNVFHLKGSILLSQNYIQTEVDGPGKEQGVAGVNLAPASPSALFYENNPLYGILFNDAIETNSTFATNEKNLTAIPYFFGVSKSTDRALVYGWTMNGQNLGVSTAENTVTFRNTTNQDGTSLIGVTIDNRENFLEEAQNSIYVNFSTPKKVFSF